MEHRGLDPRPVQPADRSARIRHRRTKRERNQARASRGPSAGGPQAPRARPRGSLSHRDLALGLSAPQPVVITQGRLSRAHRGLLSSEVKSLNVARLLSGLAEEASSPPPGEAPDTAAATAPPQHPTWGEEPSPLPPKGKENEAPGGPSPGPPSPRTLLEGLQAQLHLPGAFPRRNLVQEARAEIIGALLAHYGELPDLSQVLRGLREQETVPEPGSPQEWRMMPQGRDHPDQHGLVESRRRRRRKGKRELVFTLGATPSPPSTEKSLVLPPDPWVPSPSPPPLGPELGETTWGPQTSFDVLKSIWLPATPPTCAAPWQWGTGGAPHPPTCFPNSQSLDWSPSPPAPMPGLPWFVSRSSPEPWTFPRMRLY